MEGENSTPFFTTCDHCDEPFEPGTSYPVVTDHDDGDVELYSFCDESCRDEWEGGSVNPS
ncbi:hypothetical protein ACFO0N_05180 [Halobium salinum]|uniref:Small CPxCG-related zinc finger protein n=1 Tax=Halobium salinum TaxID=1364940 RepID=A0ABD5P8W3_9EURY|nr:hypothetical protein [Halobium salinum]